MDFFKLTLAIFVCLVDCAMPFPIAAASGKSFHQTYPEGALLIQSS